MSNTNIKNTIRVIDYIESHLEQKSDLETIADALHYSKYYLHRIFTETVGMTMHDYIRRRQLTEAAKLLVFSDRPVLEIALLSGYGSQQAFSDIFKAMYKKTPGQYREEKNFYPLQLKFTLNENPVNLKKEEGWESRITFACMEDIPAWMNLVRLVVNGFPCLDEKEYEIQLVRCIQEKRALILKDKETAVGIMVFCPENGSIDFFGVHPQYTKSGIEQAFLKKVMNEILTDKDISITTFRKGDKADPGYREIYQKLGFAEAELLTEYGYPTQRFVLQRHLKRISCNTHLSGADAFRSTEDREEEDNDGNKTGSIC